MLNVLFCIDEEVFASKKVYFVGQLIGMILATTQALAVKAAKSVKVTYGPLLPLVITIEDAIAAQSFFPMRRTVQTGEFDPTDTGVYGKVPLSDAKHFVEGVARMSAQEHFYLETQVSLVVPGREDGAIEVFSSTQNPTETQVFCLLFCTSLPFNFLIFLSPLLPSTK